MASKGYIEHLESIKFHASTKADKGSFTFKEYKTDSVKNQLVLDSNKKCAYCESFITHTAYFDIDHFRPKGAYKNSSGTDVKPGYYWLASDWFNLFLSCQICNRPSTQLIATGGKAVVGKGTHFPLIDETKRAKYPGAESEEEPLLLNPDQDDVELHLEFKDDGIVVPATVGGAESARGKKSIEIYGLYRYDLVRKRDEHLKRVRAAVVRYQRERDPYIEAPDDPNIRMRLEEAMNEIKTYLCCKQEYLTMTCQYISRECPELSPISGCSDGSCRYPE